MWMLAVIVVVMVVVPAAAAVGLRHWGLWLLKRRPGGVWRVASWFPAAGLALQVMAHGWAALIVVQGVDLAFHPPTSGDKATLLSNAISEAMNCDAFAQLFSWLVLLVSLGFLAVGTVLVLRQPDMSDIRESP